MTHFPAQSLDYLGPRIISVTIMYLLETSYSQSPNTIIYHLEYDLYNDIVPDRLSNK